jgi:hypothetical protein
MLTKSRTYAVTYQRANLLACTPLVNHWWNATFFVNSSGLVAPSNGAGQGTFDVLFDLSKHDLLITTSDGRMAEFDLVQ